MVLLSSTSAVDLAPEIARLKRELNAVILAHYYQEAEIQDVADFIGDSLQLARGGRRPRPKSSSSAACTSWPRRRRSSTPSKLVLLPDLEAGCRSSDGCPAPTFERFGGGIPAHVVVTYVNWSAAVKALSDYCCTSSNAVAVVNSIPRETADHLRARPLPRRLRRAQDRARARAVAGVVRGARDFQRTAIAQLSRSIPARSRSCIPNARWRCARSATSSARQGAARRGEDRARRRDLHRRHRAGHHPPDAQGQAARDLHPRTGRDPRRRAGQLHLVQHLPAHAPQHAAQALPVHEVARARDPPGARADRARAAADRADAGDRVVRRLARVRIPLSASEFRSINRTSSHPSSPAFAWCRFSISRPRRSRSMPFAASVSASSPASP